MSIRDYLTNTLGATHLFMLDDASRDPGSNGLPTTGVVQSGSFVADPVCEGVNNSFQAQGNTDFSSRSNGFQILNTNDINALPNIYQERTIILWFKAADVSVPTCVYEQGAQVNNFAINLGLARAITAQAADSGQPFLIAQSNFFAQAARPYFVGHIWQRHTQHAGVGNRVLLLINGVLQQEAQFTGTDAFPAHAGTIIIGNTVDNLQSYNGSAQLYIEREKNINMVAMFNDISLIGTQLRDIFERSVIPEVTIAADTVANQQAALDGLIGTAYSGVNLAIRIIQAADATDYRLILDSITFAQDPTLRDIAVQFVGPGVLTLENANGSNAVEASAPPEVDLDGVTILPGGGSILIVDDVFRVSVPGPVVGAADKLVLSAPGGYILNGTDIPVIENYAGGAVTVTLANGATVPSTLIETSGAIELVLQQFILTLTGVLTGSSILWADSSQETLQFLTNQSGTVAYTAPVGYTGDLFYAVSRPGYSKVSGRVVVNSAVQVEATVAITQVLQLNTNGQPQYGGGITSDFLSFAYSSTTGKITGTLMADITARTFFDELQLFLLSEDGCRWLLNNPDMQFLTGGAGREMLIFTQNVNVANGQTAGTRVIRGEVITLESPFDVSQQGSVQYQGVVAAALPALIT